jgi:hypothetical protein
MLLPGLIMADPTTTPVPAPTAPAEGRVTYIVDEGIVRFGKFAAAVLGNYIRN